MKRSKKVIFQLLICFGLCIAITPSFAENIRDVIVANPDSQPVPFMNVDNPARNPYQEQQFKFCPKDGSQCTLNFSPVPAERRLVVTDISCWSVQYPGISVGFGLLWDTTNSPTTPEIIFPFPKIGEEMGFSRYVGNMRTTRYYEAGSTPQLLIRQVMTASGELGGNLNCTLSGYYIQLP